MLKSMLFSDDAKTGSWTATLGGSSNNDYGQSVAVAPDGSVYVCGYAELYSTSFGAGYDDLLLAKFSSSGTLQWQKILGGSSGSFEGYSVAVAPDGSVYVCGNAFSRSSGLLFAKFSSSGTLQLQMILGSSSDYGRSVAVAPDGSVYVCGDAQLYGTSSKSLFLAKFSSSGTLQWQKALNGSSSDYGYSVAVAPDGSVYVCGTTWSAAAGDGDLFLAKFSSSGTLQWQKTLGGNGGDSGHSVAVAPDGSLYICGSTSSAGAGKQDLLLAKITEFLIEKNTVTFGSFTFQDASLPLMNASLRSNSTDDLSVSNAGLTVTTSSLTVETPSFTTNLYTF